MSRSSLLLYAADAILVLHVLFVAFVVLGLVAIYLGYFLNWGWVRHSGFRVAHLLAIAVVVLQSWLGLICPLTLWEMQLREAAGGEVYSGSFIQHWLHLILYYSAPQWVFVLAYSLFGLLAFASWFVVQPQGVWPPDQR